MDDNDTFGPDRRIEALYTLDEVARICRLSVRTLKRRCGEGKLKCVRLGERSIRIPETAVREFLNHSR